MSHTPNPDWAWTQGRTLLEVAQETRRPVVDVTLDLMATGDLQVTAIMAVRNERPIDHLAQLFSHPEHTVGSDGIFIGKALHPRAYGTFANFLTTYVGEYLTWEQAAQHVAGRTARRFGLQGRGAVRPGYIADLCLVEPSNLRDRATYDRPSQLAEGIDDVFVNGSHVLQDGQLTGDLSGRGLRRSRWVH